MLTPRGLNRTTGESAARKFVDSQGGVSALIASMDAFHEAVVHMRSERSKLMAEHPNRSVAMGRDGVVAVGNSIDDVLAKAEAHGLKGGRSVVTEFLDTDPPGLILLSTVSSNCETVTKRLGHCRLATNSTYYAA